MKTNDFLLSHMQEVTPSVVPTAVSMAIGRIVSH